MPQNQNLKEKQIREMVASYTDGIIANFRRFVPQDFIDKTQDLLKKKFTDKLLRLFAAEKLRRLKERYPLYQINKDGRITKVLVEKKMKRSTKNIN